MNGIMTFCGANSLALGGMLASSVAVYGGHRSKIELSDQKNSLDFGLASITAPGALLFLGACIAGWPPGLALKRTVQVLGFGGSLAFGFGRLAILLRATEQRHLGHVAAVDLVFEGLLTDFWTGRGHGPPAREDGQA